MDPQTERDLAANIWVEGISDGGAPLHAEANGWYWYSDYDGKGIAYVPAEWRELAPRQRAARYLRATDEELTAAEEAAGVQPHGMSREQFRAFVDSLRPRWAIEGPKIHAANVERERARERAYRERDARIARGVTIRSVQREATAAERDTWTDDASHWTVHLSYQGRRIAVPFHMGSAHRGEPKAADVLSSLILDADGIANARDFADWCSEYGYDSDSRKAERTYKRAQELSERVRRLLGDEYEERAELARDR